MRIRKHGFFADILYDGRTQPAVYHYIVQREGSNEILHWSQESSEERAITAAREELERLDREGRAAG
jgi:hypothetical protein